jgi:hypothetical protein
MDMRRRIGTLFSCLTAIALTAQIKAQGALPGSATPGSAVIYGHTIMDAVPVSGAQVSAYLVAAIHGQSSLVKQCMTWTDDKGYYTCSFLPDGDYLIALEGYGRRRAADALPLPAALLFPATMDVDRATLVSVHKQDQQEASFELARSFAAFNVSGVLSDGYRGGTLSLYSRSEQGFSYRLPITPKITKDGMFSFDAVPPGTYDLRGRELIGNTEYNSSAPVQVRTHDVSNINIVFSPQGRSELVAGLPAGIDPSLISVMMVEMGSGHRTAIDSSNAPRYEISEITPGSYWISIADQNGSDLCIDFPLNLELAAPVGKLNVSTTTQCFSINGSIEPHSAGVIVVADESLRVIGSVHTDAKGNFSIGGLRPGGYRVFGWGTINGVAYRSHDLLTKHLKDSVVVEVRGTNHGDPIILHAINN